MAVDRELRLKVCNDLEVVKEYQKCIGTEAEFIPLNILWDRHKNLINGTAKWLYYKNVTNSFFSCDDYLSLAYIAAKDAYRRYDVNNPKAKLITYVNRTVMLEIRYYIEKRQHQIGCPHDLINLKQYFNGNYNNNLKKKKEIEEKYDLADELKKTELYNKMQSVLYNSIESLDADWLNLDNEQKSESKLYIKNKINEYDIIEYKIDILRRMNEKQKMVYNLMWEEGYTIIETAKILEIKIHRVIKAREDICNMFSNYRDEILAC